MDRLLKLPPFPAPPYPHVHRRLDTLIDLTITCPGTTVLTAHYDYFGYDVFDFVQSSSNGNLNTEPSSPFPIIGTASTPPCNIQNGNKFSGSNWWLYVCTGTLNSINAVEMAFQQNGGTGWSRIVGIGLQLLQNPSKSSDWVGTISMNYQNSTGAIVHMGDKWLQNYTTSLQNQLNNLQNNIGYVYPSYELSENSTIYTLGLTYNWIYYALRSYRYWGKHRSSSHIWGVDC